MEKKQARGIIKAEPKRRLVAISAEHHAALARLAAIGRRDIGAETERLIDEELKRQASGGDLSALPSAPSETDKEGKQ